MINLTNQLKIYNQIQEDSNLIFVINYNNTKVAKNVLNKLQLKKILKENKTMHKYIFSVCFIKRNKKAQIFWNIDRKNSMLKKKL